MFIDYLKGIRLMLRWAGLLAVLLILAACSPQETAVSQSAAATVTTKPTEVVQVESTATTELTATTEPTIAPTATTEPTIAPTVTAEPTPTPEPTVVRPTRAPTKTPTVEEMLTTAVRNGDLELVEQLITAGSDATVTNSRGQTLLHQASEKGQANIVEYLLENNFIDVNVLDNNAATPLIVVENAEVALLLIEAGAELDAIRDSDGATALIRAAQSGNKDIGLVLIEAGAALDVQDKAGSYGDGATALIWAAYSGQVDFVTWLIEAGADLNIKDYPGGTALYYAEFFNQPSTAMILRAAGASQ